jgi:hypothetical protein
MGDGEKELRERLGVAVVEQGRLPATQAAAGTHGAMGLQC